MMISTFTGGAFSDQRSTQTKPYLKRLVFIIVKHDLALTTRHFVPMNANKRHLCTTTSSDLKAHFLVKRPLLVITQNARLNSSHQTCETWNAFMGNPNLLFLTLQVINGLTNVSSRLEILFCVLHILSWFVFHAPLSSSSLASWTPLLPPPPPEMNLNLHPPSSTPPPLVPPFLWKPLPLSALHMQNSSSTARLLLPPHPPPPPPPPHRTVSCAEQRSPTPRQDVVPAVEVASWCRKRRCVFLYRTRFQRR